MASSRVTGELARTDVDRGHLQRESEHLAVAIDHRATGRDERDTLAVLQVGEMREGRSPQHREVDGAREDEEEEAGDDPRDHENIARTIDDLDQRATQRAQSTLDHIRQRQQSQK